MKKITLLVASIFIFGSTVANAAEKIAFSVEKRSPADFRDAEPIVFTERGIEFFVFPDGQLDFNTRPTTGRDMFYKSGRKNGVNKTFGAPGNIRNRNHGVQVAHDQMGRVRQIGNVFINYDVNDRVKRIGSVYMTYNRFALERVGGLEIIYNRRGQIVDTVGAVKGGRAYQYSQHSFEDYDFGSNQNSSDDDYYYYKKNGSKAKIEKTRVNIDADIVINRR